MMIVHGLGDALFYVYPSASYYVYPASWSRPTPPTPIAACTTREAVEAAYRLLSGEAERAR